MSADRDVKVDETTKAPSREGSREPTAGGEDETQNGTTGTAGVAVTAISSPPGGGEGSGKDSVKGSAPPAAPGGGVDSSRRGVGAEATAVGAPAAAATVEKGAPAPMSAPRHIHSTESRSRKKRKKRMKQEAAARVAAVGGGTVEDTNGQNTEGGGKYNNDDAYPAEREATRWKQLELFRRANLFQRFPVESSPEQLVADLAHTYVKTIELTMEKRYRSMQRKCTMTMLLSILSFIPILIFAYHNIYLTQGVHVIDDWVRGENWPWFLYPLVAHWITWPLCTIPLIFCTHRYIVYNLAANLFMVPLFTIFIATGLILHLPTDPNHYDVYIERSIDGVMLTERHLEDASTEATRQKIAEVFLHVAFWAGGQSLVCILCFMMAMRTLSALRYYKRYTFEADHPAQTVEYAERAALVGQSTKRVPLTTYKNIAESKALTPRTPGSSTLPNSPAPATAVGENTPLLG